MTLRGDRMSKLMMRYRFYVTVYQDVPGNDLTNIDMLTAGALAEYNLRECLDEHYKAREGERVTAQIVGYGAVEED